MHAETGLTQDLLAFWRNRFVRKFQGSVNNTDNLVFNADPRRVGILFTGTSADRMTYTFGEPADAIDNGLTIFANSLPFYLSIEMFGVDLTRQVRVRGGSATLRSVTVYEVIQNDK